MSYFRILTGRTTPEGMFHYREDRYRIHEERDCKRCEEYRDYLFQWSPVVRFMRDEVRKLGGELDASNVVCKRCPARLTEDGNVVRQSGGFSPAHGILLCANEVRNRGHLEDSLAHEMVHAWDHLRWKVDFVGEKDLRQAACTEVSLPYALWRSVRILSSRLTCDGNRSGHQCSAASADGREKR
jgi:inner membrane protease ATP23